MPTLSAAQAQALLKYLANTQIMGTDAPLFMECVFALQMIAKYPEQPAGQPAEDPED